MRYQEEVFEQPLSGVTGLEKARPRERLLLQGAGRLSDLDLAALIIGSGIKGNTVDKIAEKLVQILDHTSAPVVEIQAVRAIPGIGMAKAAQICAALEYARRRLRPAENRIRFPQDVLPVIRHYADRRREHFLSISLNGAHEVISVRVVSIGSVNRTIVHPREVFCEPLQDRATAVLAAHNHPSGNVDPSDEDREITSRLRQAGETLGISLLDHIIFTQNSYYSFLEHGTL
ncbi:MAG: DNA repair protein RadC [Spirochaetia bacterium]